MLYKENNMTDENLAALKRLELIHEYIYIECEGNIFYPPEHNRVIFLRIKNAADMLLNKAVKILKQQRMPHYDNSGELSVNTIDQIMMLIYNTLTQPDLPDNVERKIRDAIVQLGINPDDLLRLYPWQQN